MAIDFHVRDFFHPLTIYRLHRQMERRQWQPLEELQRYQDDRLRRIVRHSYFHIPYYRHLFRELHLLPEDIHSVNDLKKLPLLSKENIRWAGRDLHAEHRWRSHSRPYCTSGSSGVPLTVYHDRRSNALEFAYYWRYWRWAGFRPGMHFAEMQTSFFLKRGDRGDALTHWQPHLGRLLLNSSRTGPARAAAMAEAIRRHGCRFLKGLASTLFAFALACRQTGEASLRFIALFTSGETLNPRHRAFLEEVFQSPVLDSYGHMERTVAISQCPRGGYHLNLDYGVLELVDLQPANNGRSRIGRAIGTSLHNMAMPFIRYDIGDEIEIFTQPEVCPCGRTLPLIKSIRGRRGSTLVAPDGTYLTSLHILPELMTGVRFVQFVQESKTDLCLRVVPDGDWPQSQRKQALELVRRAVGPSMTVVLQETTFEQLVREHSGKTPCVVPLDSGHGSVNELFLA